MLFKMDPFKDDNEIVRLDVAGRIARLRACGRDGGGATFSDAARDILLRLMNKELRRRIRCREILDHRFFM